MNYNNVSKEGVASTAIIFMLIDIIEELVLLSKAEYEKAGMKQSSSTKVLFDRLKFAASDLRKFTLSLSEEDQISFGETCEKIKEVVVYCYDRPSSIDDALAVLDDAKKSSGLNIRRFV